MLFFYAWVVLLAAVILSVPTVYLIEQSRIKKAREATEPQEVANSEVEDEPVMEEMSDEMPDEMAGFEGETPMGEDDFSAFEEEFK